MTNLMHSSGSFPLFIVILFILPHLAMSNFYPEPDEKIAKAEIQSCSGCSLNRLPEIRAFIFEDVPKFNEVSFKSIPGAEPIIIFYNSRYRELERFPLKDLTRAQCRKLLNERLFSLKDHVPVKLEF